MSDDYKEQSRLRDKIHRNLNDHYFGQDFDNRPEWDAWQYEAKHAIEELHRLPRWFEMERKGELPKTFKYCSMSPTEKLPTENKLMCCLGQYTKKCPYLANAFQDMEEIPAEVVDKAKAEFCVSHILMETAKSNHSIDTSEGYITDETDRQFWQNTYRYLAMDENDTF